MRGSFPVGETEQRSRDDVRALLNPRSVAIVGASRNVTKSGGRLTNYLLQRGYPGELALINPRETDIGGRPCYRTLADYPGDVELAVLCVPSAALDAVLADAAAKGVRCVLVNASGFAEVGAEGRARQDRLVAVARAGGMRVCGPNSQGVMNPADRFFATFSPAMEVPEIPSGSIGFVTQSGALAGSMLSRAWLDGIGFSRCVSSGNEADLTTADYLNYLTVDPATKVIALLLEGVQDGPALRAALESATAAGKPVVVFKNGRTNVGAASVESHTGSLAGSDRVYDAVFRQAGAVRVRQLRDLFDAALALDWQPLPAGDAVAIVSTSGGACTILADGCVEHGLRVPALQPATRQRLDTVIPAFGSAVNPVDVTAQVGGDPKLFTESLAAVMADPGVDSMVVMLTTLTDPFATELAEGIGEVVAGSGKPVVAVWTIAPELAAGGFAALRRHRIPVYPEPESAVTALAAMARFARFRRTTQSTMTGADSG